MKNKGLIIIYIIILSVVALGLLSFMFMGVSRDFSFWNFDRSREVLSAEVFRKEEVKKINLDVKSYYVKIQEGEVDQLRVEVFGSQKNKDNISVTLSGDTLNVRQVGSSVCFGFCFMDSEIVIYVPRDYQDSMELKSISGDIDVLVTLPKLDVKTTSGDILIDSVETGKVKTTSGEVEVKKSDYLDITTTSGDISIGKVSSINAKTTSGEVNVQEIFRGGAITSTSGDIELEKFMINENTKINTVSGEIDIRLINEANISTESRSGDKDIKSTMGEYELNLKTVSGDITVK